MSGDNNGNRPTSPPVHGNTPEKPGGTNARTVQITTRQGKTCEIPSEGIRAGEVMGYRAWRYLRSESGLIQIIRSLVVPYYWHYRGPAVGDIEKGLGIFAFKDLDFSLGELTYLVADLNKETNPLFGIVVGSCWMWGDIIEHTHGYRAQYARIGTLDQIYPKKDSGRTLAALRRDYGIGETKLALPED